jgi:CHAT domain-containing protein/tetratricopeptide (TPR) repeat protein
MLDRLISIASHKRAAIVVLALMLWLFGLTAFGQAPQSDEVRVLPPNQLIERGMSEAETHRYRFDLRANEFFQVRVEQKGVDIALKLLDASGNVLATMDSPNSKEGPEILSFITERAGNFMLEVSGLVAKAEKGYYSIRRETARTATERDKRRVDVERLFVEGMTARSKEGQSETAIARFKDALKGWRDLEDSYLIWLTERQLKTIELIAEISIPNSLTTEGHKLIREAKPESILSARAKFIEAVEAARKLFKKLGGEDLSDILSIDNRADLKANARMDEVNALRGISNTYDVSKDWQESVNYNKQAIATIREMQQDPEISASKALTSYVPLKAMEASSLFAIGTTLTSNLDKPQEGLSFDKQALTLWREVQREHEKYRTYAEFQEALILQTMAQSYLDRDDRDKAVGCFEQALTIFKRLPDQKNLEASILLQIGNVYSSQLDYEKARGVWDVALKIYEELGDKPSQASVLGLIGLSYFNVNDEQKAREFFNRELAILLSDDYWESAMKERSGMSLPDYKSEPSNISVLHKNEFEWQRAISIGNVYTILGDTEKGREYFEKSLALAYATKNQNRIRLSLSFIGSTYERQEKWQEALNYYKQMLEISRLLPGKSNLAGDLSSLAAVNIQVKQWQDASQNATEALLIYQSLGADRSNLFVGYAGALNLLARAQDGLGNRRLAIFYEKQAVNAIQRERQQLTNLDQQAQRGYLKKNEKPYQRLADWLIAEGRFAQAEQVLAMLKEEEYFDFVRRDADEIKNLSQRVPLNDKEKQLIARYGQLADRVTSIGQEFLKLGEQKRELPEGASLPSEEQKRYDVLSAQLSDANAAFKLFLDKELVAELGTETKIEIEYDRNLQAKLRKWGTGTVALRTVVTEDRYRVILTTPTVQVDGKTEIKASDLNKKVFAFRDALQHPSVDPRPLAKELYDIIIKPIEKDLRAAGAKTLVWSLDGTLRYIPLAALSPDGKTYLVEQYQNVMITPKTSDDLSGSSAQWQALGLGVSAAESVANPDKPEERLNFKPLPATKTELMSIVREEKAPEEKGVLSGKRYLDNDFTIKNFTDSLTKETADGKRKYTVVHIASHFRLGSNWSNSFLLLGNGQALTLEQLNNSPEINFGDVELITLSACNTAFADESNGKEVDSLAEAIQTKSGKAVLATLWSVADTSTSLLMSEFYRLRKENPQLTKAEALQRAQQEMVAGKMKPSQTRGERRDTSEADAETATDYTHPYYWSPFILIGNWR